MASLRNKNRISTFFFRAYCSIFPIFLEKFVKEFATKEKLEIVKVQDFDSEFLAKLSPATAVGAKTIRTISRIDHHFRFAEVTK